MCSVLATLTSTSARTAFQYTPYHISLLLQGCRAASFAYSPAWSVQGAKERDYCVLTQVRKLPVLGIYAEPMSAQDLNRACLFTNMAA
eukprot:5170236-Amphidinium_carterae.1